MLFDTVHVNATSVLPRVALVALNPVYLATW